MIYTTFLRRKTHAKIYKQNKSHWFHRYSAGNTLSRIL